MDWQTRSKGQKIVNIDEKEAKEKEKLIKNRKSLLSSDKESKNGVKSQSGVA